ncbi:MAG TPA: hypothetical protein VNX15_05185, partial [Gemmatimonadales bacterium]|nr:hypothetical protein [Gemmatimonadales bacterium]
TASADQGNTQRGVIYTIAPSPLQASLVWVGTDDGLIQLTLDDGKSWKDVTPREMTAWSRVTMVEASHVDANTAYASVDRHQLEDFDPYIYRTRDQGKTWQRITTGLPAGVYVHTVKEDLHRAGLLFAGTERGAYVSFDAGDHWQALQLNLPVTSVRDFQVYGNDLIVATHGRGFWVVDDISVLRQVDDAVLKADAYLFQPADAIEVAQGDDNGTPLQKDEPQAENPPNGAFIDYYLKTAPAGVTIEILDSSGTSLESFTSIPEKAPPGAQPQGIPNTTALWRVPPAPLSTEAGMHRVAWDPNGGRRRRGPRGGAQPTPPKLPGTFTAKLTVNGQSQTRSFMIRPDPRIASE